MQHKDHMAEEKRIGGLARYFVEYRQVGWLFLLAAVVWGVVSYFNLAQQEDPIIPNRWSVLITQFPGATAAQVEELVTKKLEKKITELSCIEETKSISRAGVSTINVLLRYAPQHLIDQQWEKIRAKVQEVTLPEGAEPPFLDTDFGNTITLLLAVTSENTPDAEVLARAEMVKGIVADLRHGETNLTDRATLVAFLPPAVSAAYRLEAMKYFNNFFVRNDVGRDWQRYVGSSVLVIDFATKLTRPELHAKLLDFYRQLFGSDGEVHPDLGDPILLMSGDDVVAALAGARRPLHSYRELEKITERLEDDLKLLADVGKVAIVGNVPETIYLRSSQKSRSAYELSPEDLRQAIAGRNAVIPGGFLRTEGQIFPVTVSGAYVSEYDLGQVVVGIKGADRLPVYLRDVFDVQRGYVNPIPYSVDVLDRNLGGALERKRTVLLSVEMKDGSDINKFAVVVGEELQRFESGLPPGVKIIRLSDQQESVVARIHHFGKCFAEAVLVVVIVCLFLMDWRSALIVALAIPLTVCMTLGGMYLCKIPLHQISIASLIIALGMLVDDPIVATDAINRELYHGQPRETAAWLGPYKLRRAIFFGTIINIVAFLPLALLKGDSGSFIFALPVVVAIALISSRIVSMTFVPLLGYYLLRGQKGLEEGGDVRPFFLFKPVDMALLGALPRYKAILGFGMRYVWVPVAIGYGLLLVTLPFGALLEQQFFPPADRRQVLLDIELPKAASIAQTRHVCDEVVKILEKRPEIESAGVFIGGNAPRFYCSLDIRDPTENLAQVLINTRSAEDVREMIGGLQSELDRSVVGARCLLKQLDQGPAIDAPIQIRLMGANLDALRSLADQVVGELRRAGGYKIFDDLGYRVPEIEVKVNQDRANILGVENPAIGETLKSAFGSLRVTELREGDHLVPVVIRLQDEERNEIEKLKWLYVYTALRRLVPLDSFAGLTIRPEYPAIPHFNKLRCVTVKAYAPFGQMPATILAKARGAIDGIAKPYGYRLQYAGEDKELRESQADMNKVMAISLSLIALTMVVQFKSVMKSVVVMLVVPLGLIGALLGLLTTGSPFGFMALLGIVSLAGVIVSHIIVLSDYVEEARAEGCVLEEALTKAGLVRLRAVLVTVLATVGGLIPLFLTGGPLWEPLASVHIFGLLLATLLTLVMLPILYYIFCAKLKWFK